MNQDELKKLTISTASELLASKKLSSVELTQATLDVIEQQEPVINAFITVTKEIALARAKQVDELRAKNERLSILAGIPYSLKDVYNVKGVQTTGGAKILEGYIS
ncbi:Asp-tRNA(Asn)/Glu-tRNA(Gln) amidotransferase GatCAB subunit A, partial [Candidatus Dojkabacteria bacterium CG_4_10_14_3_um_filter_Dojkabacteria_WS6_41_9]